MMPDTVAVRAPQSPKGDTKLAVMSATFHEGGSIPMDNVFTGCGGKNTSPQLSWSGRPSGTKSFAITCFDPDAPTGAGYWHWLVFNVASSVTSLEAGAGQSGSPGHGTTGFSDFAMNSYGGPCPPKGDGPHRYIFTVYALDVDSLPGAGETTTGSTLVFLMRGHVLATGSLTGTFGH
jgi:Raf kinase inhibitor-like YbhB/YbcL family protein